MEPEVLENFSCYSNEGEIICQIRRVLDPLSVGHLTQGTNREDGACDGISTESSTTHTKYPIDMDEYINMDI